MGYMIQFPPFARIILIKLTVKGLFQRDLTITTIKYPRVVVLLYVYLILYIVYIIIGASVLRGIQHNLVCLFILFYYLQIFLPVLKIFLIAISYLLILPQRLFLK